MQINTEKNHISGFEKKDTQCVKGIAIVMMLIHHCFLSPARYEGQEVVFAPFSESAANSIALSFRICVAVFTFLSAYGMTISYKKRSHDLILRKPEFTPVLIRRLTTLVMNFLFIFILIQLYDVMIIRDDMYHTVYGKGPVSILYFVIDGLGLAELFSTPTYLATFWYMSLAIICILILPGLIKIYKAMGAGVLLAFSVLFAIMFPIDGSYDYAALPLYMCCISMGIISADTNLIARLAAVRVCSGRIINGGLRLVVLSGVLLVAMYYRQKTEATMLLPLWNGVIPLIIAVVTLAYINRIPLVGRAFQFLGKHSMNIFLLHNFVRAVWYYDFTYSFRKWWLIVLVLLGISLLLSILIEALKKTIRYDRLIARTADRITRNCCTAMN